MALIKKMRNAQHKNQTPISLGDMMPVPVDGRFARIAISLADWFLGVRQLSTIYGKIYRRKGDDQFCSQALNSLGVRYHLNSGSLARIPKSGPVVVVCNHPSGAIEGLVMLDLLLKLRNDVRLMANGFLGHIPELRDHLISVNPYGGSDAVKSNSGGLRECLHWLRSGGLLLLFPAGDVSAFQLKTKLAKDLHWNQSFVRLAELSNALIAPVHVTVGNSLVFQLFGSLHPRLKTLLLPREILKKRGADLAIDMGEPLHSTSLARLGSLENKSMHIKACLEDLPVQKIGSKIPLPETLCLATKGCPRCGDKAVEIARELCKLPAYQTLLIYDTKQVVYAKASQIPFCMQEIGRLREISFRSVGEGSGRTIDVDFHDSKYYQLIVWDTESIEIIGGYRVGFSDEIIEKYGLNAIYSHSLFKFDSGFFHKFHNALEIGRSFVIPKYQKEFLPLFLLWKGIMRLVAMNPKYQYVFGAASISDSFCESSKQLMISFMWNHFSDQTISQLIKPRHPVRLLSNLKRHCAQSNTFSSIKDCSTAVSRLEMDGKGMPVLIKHYLKLGGKVFGFSVDQNFSNCIDVLIMVDFSRLSRRVLEKYMGRKLAQEFIEYHLKKESSDEKVA